MTRPNIYLHKFRDILQNHFGFPIKLGRAVSLKHSIESIHEQQYEFTTEKLEADDDEDESPEDPETVANPLSDMKAAFADEKAVNSVSDMQAAFADEKAEKAKKEKEEQEVTSTSAQANQPPESSATTQDHNRKFNI